MKKIINTKKAPKPIGPYNQGIIINKTLYTAGQIPLLLNEDKLLDGSLEEQTHLVMNHLHEILKAGGMRFSDVVKSVLYLENMDDFQQVNAIYAKYFDEGYAPVRETVAVKKLPKGAKVEISMIAVDSD